MSGAAGPNNKPKTNHFHAEWEEDFFFTMSFSKCICLVCQTTIAILKKGNVERQHCLSSKKWAEKEKGEGTKITINRTTVVFHSGIHKQRPPSKHHYRWVTMERCLSWCAVTQRCEVMASERCCRLRVFLTAIRRVYRHHRYYGSKSVP